MTIANRPRLVRAVATAAGSALMLATVTGALRPLPASAGPITTTVTVSTTGDVVDGVTTSISALTGSQGADGRISLREAITAADNTPGVDVVDVPPGTYTLTSGALPVGLNSGSNISITGTGTAANTSIAGDGTHRVLVLDPNLVGNVTVAVSGVTISGGHDDDGLGGAGIIAGNPFPADTTTLSNCVVSGNHTTSTTATNAPGGGIQNLGGSLSITNCTISGNSSGSSPGGGLDFETLTPHPGSLTITNSTFSGDSLSNADPTSFIGGGGAHVQAMAGSTVSLSGDSFSGNTATGTSSGPVGGGGLWLEGGASITSSTFTGNQANGPAGTLAGGGALNVGTGTVGLHFDRIAGNTASHGPGGLLNSNAEAVTDASNSWWGCNAGPGSAGCDVATGVGSGTGSLTLTPRLQLTASASATNLLTGATASIAASLTHNSASGDTLGSGHVLDGTPVGFAGTLGGVSPSSQGTTSGAAGTTFTAGSTTGPGGVGVTVDNQLVNVALNVGTAPAITSANATTFIATTPGTFTVTATGSPSPTFTETGTLPSGVTLSTGGVLAGTVASTATGTYPITITAHNGFGSDATQGFTLTVNPLTQAPAVTSAVSASFTEGVSGSYTVTATGIPTPTLSLTGTLPSGLSFNPATGVLSGTPDAGSHGTYLLTAGASNGVLPDAGLGVTVTVGAPPAITSANATTFTVGSAGSFQVTASGFPAPSIGETGPLPTGVTYDPLTGLLSGTPAAGTGGSYPISLGATNGFGSDATQSFTLTVDEAPSITSANATTFTAGSLGAFGVTATGYPAPTLGATGDVPTGVSLGGANLGGTPAAGTGGTHAITLTASNGVGTDSTQSFTLTVDEVAAFTSADHATFTAGSAGSLGLTASGFPAPIFTVTSGTLPGGVTLTGATLGGTPDPGTGGTYNVTLAAHNGIGADATQSLTLTVDEAPHITSAASTTFALGTPGTFTVTATGTPAPALSLTGTLPAGVSFDTATGVLSGTPTGAGSSAAVDITASNGIGSDDVQHFTLTVTELPSITSAGSTTFGVGVAGTFTVTAGGFPIPTLSETGTLPGGVSFDPSTGRLAGTPDPGTANDYPISFTASNGVGPDQVQSFTLHVDQPAAITSAGGATFTTGSAGTFTVTGSGFPTATLGESGTLPGGVTFDPSTGKLAGTPDPGTGGSYAITFTASNGVGTDATQSFTLTVDQAPSITSANAATFLRGTAGTFTLTATGFPAPSFSLTGTMPSGLSLDPVTGVLSGTPAAATAGVYTLTAGATNGAGTDATQAFTLTVQEPTSTTVTSSNLHVLLGQPVTFTATVGAASGTPTGWVSFLDGGSPAGSGTLAVAGGVMTATWTTSSLSAATHPITAQYSGDTTDAQSTSTPAMSEVVTTVAGVTVTPHSHTLRANGTTNTLLKVVVTDLTSQPVAGDTLTFASTPSGAVVFSAPTAITDATGTATITLTSTTTAQPVTITVTESIGGVSGTATEKLLATRIKAKALVADHIPANGTSTAVAMVTLVDGAGNPVKGETITFATDGRATDATLAQPSVDTDASGVAADTLTSSTTAGAQAITVSDEGSDDPTQNFATTLALTQTPAGGSTPSSFIHNAYVTLLGRDADPAGFAYWLDRLNHGLSRSAMAEALAASAEYRGDVIGGTSTVPGLYQQYLGRSGSPGEVAYWLGLMATGLSFEQVRLGMLSSPEYPLHHGGDPGATIDALYEDVLGRPSDPGGRAYWLANYNAATIAAQFIESREGREHLVSVMYGAILNRAPDSVGLSFWTQQLLNGATDEHIIGALLGSDEYFLSH